MATTIQVGDKGVTIRAVIYDQAGAVQNLTGATVDFIFQGPDNVEIEVAGAVEDAATGKAKYDLLAADGVGEIVGTWRWQVALTLPSGWDGKTVVSRFEALSNV